jgi:hypothetical protein
VRVSDGRFPRASWGLLAAVGERAPMVLDGLISAQLLRFVFFRSPAIPMMRSGHHRATS